MNAKLQAKLNNIKNEQQKKSLLIFFRTITGCHFIEWTTDVISTTYAAWSKFTSLHNTPASSIKLHSQTTELERWILECSLNMKLSSPCFISVDMNLPWAKIQFESPAAFFKLWSSISPKDFVLLSEDKLFCFFDEEDKYDFFM